MERHVDIVAFSCCRRWDAAAAGVVCWLFFSSHLAKYILWLHIKSMPNISNGFCGIAKMWKVIDGRWARSQ